jgi:hypothetical protein
MTSGKNQSKLPEWFQGDHYSNGDIVTNPFSGEKYKLNAEELSMYDFIMGAQYTIEIAYDGDIFDPSVSRLQKELYKGIDWFRENNAKAYMVLLD